MTCYLCNIILTDDSISEEHIIPESIGGKLTSKELLCRKCNNEAGVVIDAQLSELLTIFRTKYNITNKKNKVPTTNIRLDSGNLVKFMEYNSSTKWLFTPIDPQINKTEDNFYSFNVSTLKRALQEIEKLKKTGDNILFSPISNQIEPSTENLTFTREINVETIRSACKIALNYYLFKKGDRDLIRKIAEFIKNGTEENNFFSWPIEPMIGKDLFENEPYHIVFIKGDRKTKLLFSYIELFSAVAFVISINPQYKGHDFIESYVCDPRNGKEIMGHFDIPMKPENLFDYLIAKPKFFEAKF